MMVIYFVLVLGGFLCSHVLLRAYVNNNDSVKIF